MRLPPLSPGVERDPIQIFIRERQRRIERAEREIVPLVHRITSPPEITSEDQGSRYFDNAADFQNDVNGFVQAIAEHHADIEDIDTSLPEEDKWRLDRAIIKSAIYSDYSEVTPEVWSHFLAAVGVDRRRLIDKFHHSVNKTITQTLFVNERSFNTADNFSPWTYAMRGTPLNHMWDFERFIREVNDGGDYNKRYSPSERGLYPGSGITVRGIKSKVFPDNYLKKRFIVDSTLLANTYQQVQGDYRELLVKNELYLRSTSFGSFKYFFIIRNPRKMVIDGKSYALIVFHNDNSQNKTQRVAYLIPDKYAIDFFSNPLKNAGTEHMFYPEATEKRLGREIINLNSSYALSGFDNVLPGDRVLKKSLSDRKKLHDEIITCALFGFSMLDLLEEAYRFNRVGYYTNQDGNWYLDKYRLMRELIKWNITDDRTVSIGTNDTTIIEGEDKRPILFPLPVLEHTIDPSLIRECGVIDGGLFWHRTEKDGGNYWFFRDGVPELDEELNGIGNEHKWKDLLGSGGATKWDEYHDKISGLNPALLDPMVKKIALGVIGGSCNDES